MLNATKQRIRTVRVNAISAGGVLYAGVDAVLSYSDFGEDIAFLPLPTRIDENEANKGYT